MCALFSCQAHISVMDMCGCIVKCVHMYVGILANMYGGKLAVTKVPMFYNCILKLIAVQFQCCFDDYFFH